MLEARNNGFKGLVSRFARRKGSGSSAEGRFSKTGLNLSRTESPNDACDAGDALRDAIREDQYTNARNFKVEVVAKDSLAKDDIIIVLMGPTGSGKSTFINTATGFEGWTGHGLQSHTNEVQAVRITFEGSVHVVLVDTPGFDDTYRTDLEILELTSQWLKKTYENDLYISGILYTHRISDNRMSGAPLKNLKTFEKLCGEDVFRKVVLVTTMWQDVEPKIGEARERELKNDYWAAMIKEGSKTLRFKDTTKDSAWATLNYIITLEIDRQAFRIQNELVNLKKDLPDTQAGRQLRHIIEQWVAQQTNVLEQLREEMSRSDDPETIRQFAALLTQIREKRDAAVQEMRHLDSSLVGRVRRLFSKI